MTFANATVIQNSDWPADSRGAEEAL